MAFGFAAGGWSFLLHGLTLLGLPLTAVLRPEPWVAGTFSTYGATVIVLFSALLLGYIAVNAPPRRTAAGAGALALLAIGLAATLSGHASTAEPQWLMKMAVFIHVVCIAWWVGSLFPLGLVLGEGRSRAAPPLVRFSRWIPFAIVPLVASGVTLAVVQLGWPGAAWLSPYGYVLAGKLVLLLILFAAACYNRWVLTAPAVRGEARAMQRMRRTILTEIILVLAILALVAGWRFTPPPRALADATDPVLTATSVELIDGAITATVLLDSPMVGAVSGTLSLASTDGKLMIPRSVAVSFALPDAGIEEIDAELVPDGEGAWEIQGVVLPVPGEWQVEVEVRVSDFDLARMRGELVVVP
jgi:copper transport protein